MVVPMEDSMETLIENLVSPLLPRKSTSHVNPSPSQQEALAKQMRAVVILYNFYYRKQFPQIEFLSFQSLCKSSAIANPAIISYYQFMQQKQTIDKISTISSEDLSIVEKTVINACDISISLYNSFNNTTNNNGISIIESWPIERIGVVLVDKKREKCLLERDILVTGAWSLVEREIERGKGNTSCVLNESFDEILENLAVFEVESRTGIESSDLRTRYRHLTYSLNKEKSSTRVYIMEYSKQPAKNALAEVPIEFVIDRLKDPVIKTGSPPEATSALEYFLLLPYIAIISDWIKNPITEDSNNSRTKQTEMNQKIPMEIEKAQINGNNSNGSQKLPMDIEKAQKSVRNQTSNGSQKIRMEIKKTERNFKDQMFIGSQKEPMEIEKNLKSQTFNGSQKVPMEIEKMQNNVRNKTSNRSPKEKCVNENEKIDNKRKHVGPPNNYSMVKPLRIDKETGTKIDGTSKNESKDGTHGNRMVSKEMIEHCTNTMRSCDETLVKTEIVAFEKKDFESCMQVVVKKRDELCKRHKAIQDEFAQCEMDIHTMKNEGEMTPKVESIVAKWGNPNSIEIQIKKKLKVKSFCQELDDVCRENNLTLPRYNVLPSITDGMYSASASIKDADFECTTNSNLKKTPKEAREHAASRMLKELRRIPGD